MADVLQPEQLARARILVRVPNWVGDAVMCLPALQALRRSLPDAALTLLARPWVRDVFPAEALGCDIISYDTAGEHRGIAGRWRMARALRLQKFDAALLFQNAFDAALVTWMAGTPVRGGYSRHGRGPLLTHPVPPPGKGAVGHETHYYLELLRQLGLIPGYEKVARILLPCSDGSRRSARAQLQARLAQSAGTPEAARADRFVVGISPGATFGTAKRWPAPRFAELAVRLYRECDAACVFFGAPQEKDLAEHVVSLSGIPALSLAGKISLAEFIQLIPGCDLFVTNDSGTMHVAAALGVPTLAIFGPTNEHETRPLGEAVEIVTGEAFCRPCKLRHCPIDHRCMNSIVVDEVLHAAQRLLHKALQEAPPLQAATAASAGAGRQAQQAR